MTPDTMTAQKVFDTVARHLFSQGVPANSTDRHGYTMCRYRTENGLKCAVGCLIPDTAYSVSMENVGVASVVAVTRGLAHLSPYCALLTDLQNLHDTGFERDTTTADMQEALTAIALEHRISPAALSTLSFKDR